MSDLLAFSATPDPANQDGKPDPVIRVSRPETEFDLATIIGLLASIVLIAVAILLGRTNANFFDTPSVLIVILGTITVTLVSYTSKELQQGYKGIEETVVRHVSSNRDLAKVLLDLGVIARKRGFLALSVHDRELSKIPFLGRCIQMLTDGFSATDIEHVMGQEIDTMLERRRRGTSILRRAAEIAPAMGLIGTLIGLVQMLAVLDDPGKIGPAMALALLTTFYGAVLGSVVLAPVAAKMERNANLEALQQTLIINGVSSMARQENPRRTEIILNSILPPEDRIRYFD